MSRVTEKLSEEEDRDEDERLLQEFEDEVADLSVPSDKIEEIKEEMQKEFDNIINEVDVHRVHTYRNVSDPTQLGLYKCIICM